MASSPPQSVPPFPLPVRPLSAPAPASSPRSRSWCRSLPCSTSPPSMPGSLAVRMPLLCLAAPLCPLLMSRW
eukprot:1377680-Alexandrium_andersonii.AAC.1